MTTPAAIAYVLLTVLAACLRAVQLLSGVAVEVLGRLVTVALEVLGLLARAAIDLGGLVVELLARLADAADPAVLTGRTVVVTTARSARPAAA
jgi:hypothetical protein